MIGFSIMMVLFCSFSYLLVFSIKKGNCSSVSWKVFETTNDRKGYAKALGKPDLFLFSGSDCGYITERLCYYFYCSYNILFIIVVVYGCIRFKKRFS